ncbi:glycosyltransferase [Erythrobacter dokdonensis]|uniref:Glycosyl transferase, group 2 family protein n=1 Tax=Erythrobacter dokdonensis DSW-74 TaxID=1300349 RepID=A0A1A7BIE2_9SPHN|nr:glycosyltransferase [Erythrobacter dokdonensis]OBV11217.1 Glycosyl transferase, group 2 family protein [Erythrobacter dokdonensis DSW-74]
MATTDPTAFTVIIPAHNEEAVIARCLNVLLADVPADSKMQVIIAANGCSDDTVAIARKVAPGAVVLDLPVGSKTAAMNAANREALYFPRIYLDADVQCSYDSLQAVAQVLREPGIMTAAPALRMDLSRSNWLARAYYRVWLTQPYVKRALVGSGCFGLSKAAYERIGDFPPITGDDIWVYSRFSETERRNIANDAEGRPVWFLVSPPRRAIDQIRVETRRRLGNEQVLRDYPSPHYAGSNNAGDLYDALHEGASVLDVLIYLAIKAVVRLRVRRVKRKRKDIVWERDLAAREV